MYLMWRARLQKEVEFQIWNFDIEINLLYFHSLQKKIALACAVKEVSFVESYEFNNHRNSCEALQFTRVQTL